MVKNFLGLVKEISRFRKFSAHCLILPVHFYRYYCLPFCHFELERILEPIQGGGYYGAALLLCAQRE